LLSEDPVLPDETSEANRLSATSDPASTATLADRVHDQIRHEIVFGLLRPNQHLVESDIADRLDVSRTPVRETLQRLATEGLIVSRRRRWVVYEHTPSEIREIYETRMALEGFAARLASERANEREIAEMVAVMSELEGPSSEGEARVEANERFHGLIISAAGNRRLAEEIQRSQRYYFNVGIVSQYTLADISTSQHGHSDLLTAIQEHDGDRAEAACRSHIGHALRLILDRLPARGDPSSWQSSPFSGEGP
jgi:DNA-binding GntR family transcriptional regulator